MVFKTYVQKILPYRGVNGNGHAFLIEKEFYNEENEPSGLAFHGPVL